MSVSGRRSSASATPWLVGVVLLVAAASAVLVVWFQPPTAAVLLVVDKSGSMAGDPIRHVRESCLAVGKALKPEDSIGVIAFDGKPRWVVPFSRVGEAGSLRAALGRLDAEGGSALYPALAEALRVFQADPRARSARVKHVLLLSDGVTVPADFETVVRALAREGVTVSTVCVGVDAFDAPLLSRIASWSGGRFLFVDGAAKLPNVVVQETRRALRP